MIPAVLIFGASAVTLTALIALLSGAGLALIAGGYITASLVLAAAVIFVSLLHGRNPDRSARYQSEIEAEMIALRESALLDTRFGSGSPEALSPVLHRSLMMREEAIEISSRENSEMLIRLRN